MLITCLSSASAAIVARLACHPLDTAKARLQGPRGMEFRSTGHALRVTFREEGVRGLYRGVGATIVGGSPAMVIYLATYEVSKARLESVHLVKDSPFLGHFTAGLLAEAASCLIFVPVDVVKERLQVQRKGEEGGYKGSTHALRTILKKEGLRGIYKGYGATLLSFGPFSAFYFMFYEQAKAIAKRTINTDKQDPEKGDLPFPVTLGTSAAAGALAAFITNPLDMAKLRLQVQRGAIAASTPSANNVSNTTNYANMFDGIRKIYKEGGIRHLFKGAGARVAFHTPSTAIIMMSYEEFKKFYVKLLSDI